MPLVLTASSLAGPWAKDDSGGYYKAALLSGPPGVGEVSWYYSLNSTKWNIEIYETTCYSN